MCPPSQPKPGAKLGPSVIGPVVLGKGRYRFSVNELWGRLPEGKRFGDAPGVCVDSQDRVFVLTRGPDPVMVFDRAGNFLMSWGHDIGFGTPHGAAVGPDDALYLTDDTGACVRKFTTEGTLLLTIGMPDSPSTAFSGEPFNRCTHTALSPQGDIYVSDGYGNARVHKFDPAGHHLMSWGTPGTGPGEFHLVHNICADQDGWIYVADRENRRIQVFDSEGRYETQFVNLARPCGLALGRGAEPMLVIGELGPHGYGNIAYHAPNIGPRLSLVSLRGETLARLGEEPVGVTAGRFIAPHSIAVDSHGDIYVGEVSNTYWPLLFGETPAQELRCLQKLERLR